MDPPGQQNRVSGGKRRSEVFSGEEEMMRDNQKVARRWMAGRTDDSDRKDVAARQNLDYRALSVDHWMRLQQQQKVEPPAPTTPLNLQQRAMATSSLHDLRTVDSSKQTLLSVQQAQQLGPPQQPTQHAIQQTCGGQILKFHQLETDQLHMQLPYMDFQSSSRPLSSLANLPLSFRPPPIFAESDLRHSPTSSSSNPYPVQNVVTQSVPLASTLVTDSEDDRYPSMLCSNQSGSTQQSQAGLSGVPNALVMQELQVSTAWYSSMRELETQPNSISRLGRVSQLNANGQSGLSNSTGQAILSTGQSSVSNGQSSLSNGQVNLANGQGQGQGQGGSILYSSQTLNDLTNQAALGALPFQSCPTGIYRESSTDQEQLLGDPQSSLRYPVSGGITPSSMGCPKSSSSSMGRLNKPAFQNEFQSRGLISGGAYCASSSGADPFSNSNFMVGGSLPDDTRFMQCAPPPPKPVRTFTKVYKLGAIGRALDVTRFSNYTELRCELARMFGLEGQLDQRSGWQLVFLDNENDILLVGDDPWEEFVTSVRGIRILSPSEVNFFYMSEERFGGAYSNLTSTSGVTKQF